MLPGVSLAMKTKWRASQLRGCLHKRTLDNNWARPHILIAQHCYGLVNRCWKALFPKSAVVTNSDYLLHRPSCPCVSPSCACVLYSCSINIMKVNRWLNSEWGRAVPQNQDQHLISYSWCLADGITSVISVPVWLRRFRLACVS